MSTYIAPMLTHDLIAAVCRRVEDGETARDAASAEGVDYRTLASWLRRGPDERHSIYWHLWIELDYAEYKRIALAEMAMTRVGQS